MAVAVLAAVVCGAGVAAAEGQVTGSVKFTGTPPEPQRVKMDADPQCALHHKEPVTKNDVVVNSNGTLQWVFVYVKEGLTTKPAPSTEPVVLDQQGCMYAPHVMGIQVGQPLQIVNSDATLHNVNCKPTKSKPFNIAQPTKGMKTTKQFTAPEMPPVVCKCNVHPWMASYIGVVDHPYFGVTDDTGAFTINGLPAGTYTLEAWHEKFGTATQQVTVAEGQPVQADFEFAGQ
jgi:plastocyanin